jgi:hypothetical protein
VVADQADPARLERLNAEDVEQLLVERGFTADREVLADRLRADEPVILDSVEVTADELAQLAVRWQRNSRSEVVVVVVLEFPYTTPAISL